jgi:ADP-ribosyl-[dinitrogen reductase] hydrolase
VTTVPTSERYNGFLIGTAVGDSIGLSREGIGRRRAARMFGDGPLTQGLIFGCGMVSDDTEHMRMTAVALLRESQDPNRFARILGWKLKWWLLALPAGTGMATAKAIIRLWLGWPPNRSGVFSAGNGPAMRSGIIGLCLYLVRASTRITHTDPRAETGAVLIALAVREAIRTNGVINASEFLALCRQECTDDEWQKTISKVEAAVAAEDSAIEFAQRIGCGKGISGYIIHTVAAVLFCWLRWPGEFRRPLEQIVKLGGDTDTTGAILGGLAGATCGIQAIPPEWTDRLIEWPYSATWLQNALGKNVHRQFAESDGAANQSSQLRSPLPRPFNGLMVLLRNVAFLMVVLAHGFRRLLPPY